METRAPYLLIGTFLLAVILAMFGFVYWMNNIGGIGDRAVYQVRFQNTVSGLLRGAPVLFNGLRVGEVTGLRIDPNQPRQIVVTLAVDQNVPVRGDTTAGLEFQGLTGVAAVALSGGNPTAPLLASDNGEPPQLAADPMAGQSVTQAARDALRQVNAILADNADPLKKTLANLDTFSGALARNSEKIDKVMEGLGNMFGGDKPTPVVYDLTAPKEFPPSDPQTEAQLAINDPTATLALDTQKILVANKGGDSPSFPEVQWSDSIPKLIQAKVLQSFENANMMRSVSRASEGLDASHQLALDIRAFHIVQDPQPTAEIEFAAKILADGKVVDAKVFRGAAPASGTDAAAYAAALNEAFGKAATELVGWTLGALKTAGPDEAPPSGPEQADPSAPDKAQP